MITDVGLDAIGNTHAWLAAINYCALGTGNNNNRRDTSPVTVSQSGTTLTASGSFFLSTDVGALFKFGTGSSGLEVYVTAYISATQVTVNISSTQAAQVGTLWFVDQTGLQTQVIAPFNSTYFGDVASFNNTGGIATTTLTRHFLSPIFGSSHTIQELGWFATNGVNPLEMFGRALVGGTGDSVLAGQQYEVICELSIVSSPSSPTAVPDVSGGTWDTSGMATLEQANICLGSILNGNNPGVLEPSDFSDAQMLLATATFTQTPMTNSGVPQGASTYADSYNVAAYVSGSFTRSMTATWNVTTAVTTIYGIILARSGSGGRAFSILFNTPVAKDNLHRVILTWTVAWQRVLTN